MAPAAPPLTVRTPMWLRLAEYAADHATATGVVLLRPGQLRRDLGAAQTSHVSRAIRGAVAAGWLDPRSTTTTLLVMPAKRRSGVAR